MPREARPPTARRRARHTRCGAIVRTSSIVRKSSNYEAASALAPGNAASLRAFLACGFVPIGAEVLVEPDERDDG